MKKNTFKSILCLGFTLFSFCITAQGVLPSNDIFRLRNVATGQFLTDAGVSATAVTMTNLGEEDQSTHFKFVQSGAFYNIDSEVLEILRAPGASGPGGAYVVVSTTKASPAADTDKTWTIYHNNANDTYRFGSRTTGRFMYHEVNGTVTHAVATDTDDRSNWELIPYVQTPVVIAPDEDTSTDLSCLPEFENNETRNVDIPNAVNVGTADDRSCYSDYSESEVNGKTWGIYNITDGSNHWDGASLQPRIERSLPRSGETGVGSYARFTGTFRILEVGDAGSFSQNGTYIAQAKGKHSGGGGSNDPAICLYLAKPVYGTGINADKQVAFDIYAERILERGGEGSGREEVFLKQVNKNDEIDFELEVGFREDPNDPTKKIHYCDAVIGGDPFNYNIPDPERGLESGVRYGAYRVKGGRAQIRWTNTTYQKEEIVDNGGSGPADDIYRLRNVATGKYLTAVGSSANPVTMSDSGGPQNTHWTFVESGAFFNIDNETYGILRAPGSGGPGGAYVVLSTGIEGPDIASDKTWTIHHNASEDTYRFESRTAGRFLYNEVDGSVTHNSVLETDDRSKWILESTTLTIHDRDLKTASIKIYPNPAQDVFTIAFKNLRNVKVRISDMLGKVIYQTSTKVGSLELSKSDGFSSGLYIIQVSDENGQIVNKKLMMN
jgi:hypothetical protein